MKSKEVMGLNFFFKKHIAIIFIIHYNKIELLLNIIILIQIMVKKLVIIYRSKKYRKKMI
jgi:hypothetical protein